MFYGLLTNLGSTLIKHFQSQIHNFFKSVLISIIMGGTSITKERQIKDHLVLLIFILESCPMTGKQVKTGHQMAVCTFIVTAH